MTKTALLTAIAALATANESVLADVRGRVLAGQAGTPYDASRPLFAGVTLSPSGWAMVSRIERTAAEVDALIAGARRELANDGDVGATAVERHQGTPQAIGERMSSLNADISSLTGELALKSVSFSWSLLPER
jgi:hypothetical protein